MKSAVQALPHAMQFAHLPRCLYDKVDKKHISFIWGDMVNHRHIHTTASNNLCKPKSVGGLGLRKSRDTNLTFMMKVG